MRESGCVGPAWKGREPAGAWRRRREIVETAVEPSAEWARGMLAECHDGDGGGWEARMGFHHVLEVSERIVEFCEEREEEREA